MSFSTQVHSYIAYLQYTDMTDSTPTTKNYGDSAFHTKSFS